MPPWSSSATPAVPPWGPAHIPCRHTTLGECVHWAASVCGSVRSLGVFTAWIQYYHIKPLTLLILDDLYRAAPKDLRVCLNG